MGYVTSAGAPDAPCVFCSALAAGDDRRALILRRGQRAFLILNAFPYATGHLMAMPIRHVATVEDATADELTETMTLVSRCCFGRRRCRPSAGGGCRCSPASP